MKTSRYVWLAMALIVTTTWAAAETPVPEQTTNGTRIWPAPRSGAGASGERSEIIWSDAPPAASSDRTEPSTGSPDRNGIIWNDPPARAQAETAAPRTPSASLIGECRPFDADITIEGRRQPMHGMACLQPDGRWRVVSQTPR